MAKVPSDDVPGTARGGGPADDSPPRAPRWVKVAAIIAAVLVLIVVIVKLTGLGGEHGPGRHVGGGHGQVSAPAAQTLIGARG